jgi:hypothetical protein
MRESNIARKLTKYESELILSEWYGWEEKEARECYELIIRKFYGSLEIRINDEDDIVDILDNESSSIYLPDMPSPEDEYLKKHDISIIRKSVETVLQEEEKNRDIYRALFTAYYITTVKDYKDMLSVLDKKVIEAYNAEGKMPARGEILMKYNDKITNKESADTSASTRLKEFFNKLSALEIKEEIS